MLNPDSGTLHPRKEAKYPNEEGAGDQVVETPEYYHHSKGYGKWRLGTIVGSVAFIAVVGWIVIATLNREDERVLLAPSSMSNSSVSLGNPADLREQADKGSVTTTDPSKATMGGERPAGQPAPDASEVAPEGRTGQTQ